MIYLVELNIAVPTSWALGSCRKFNRLKFKQLSFKIQPNETIAIVFDSILIEISLIQSSDSIRWS